MQLICHITLWYLGVMFCSVRAQLLYTDSSKDDGPCTYPSPVPLLNANFKINPLRKYYIPAASENFYRFQYHMAKNQPAETEADVTSLQSRLEVSKVDLIEHLSAITVSFFGTPDVNYSYIFVPAAKSASLTNPVFDFNATMVHGSSGTAPTGSAGEIIYTLIWNDDSPAWNIYTCIGGRQMFHIVTGAPSLTDDQMETNKQLLTEIGFNPDNFQFLQYSD